MDTHFRPHRDAHAYVLTFYTALRPSDQRSGSVLFGRNGYRYSCSAIGFQHSFRPIGGQSGAKTRYLLDHSTMVCLESFARFLDWSDHADTVCGFADFLHHLGWHYGSHDHGACSSRAARQVEWPPWPLCGTGDHSCADHWRAHLEGTWSYICLYHPHSFGSPFEVTFIVHGTGNASRAKPCGDGGRLNSTDVPAACGKNGLGKPKKEETACRHPTIESPGGCVSASREEKPHQPARRPRSMSRLMQCESRSARQNDSRTGL